MFWHKLFLIFLSKKLSFIYWIDDVDYEHVGFSLVFLLFFLLLMCSFIIIVFLLLIRSFVLLFLLLEYCDSHLFSIIILIMFMHSQFTFFLQFFSNFRSTSNCHKSLIVIHYYIILYYKKCILKFYITFYKIMVELWSFNRSIQYEIFWY